MDNTKKTSLQEAKANFEEIKKFAKQAAKNEFEDEINKKVDQFLKESLTIEVDESGDVTIEKDGKVVEMEKNENGDTEVEVEDTTTHNKEEDEEPIEIDENLEEMITFEEQEQLAPQPEMETSPEAPVGDTNETPELPADDNTEAPTEETESVETIAQNLADELVKLVQTANDPTSANGNTEVVIDDEKTEAPNEKAPAPAPEPAPAQPTAAAPPIQEDELFEISLDEIDGDISDEDNKNDEDTEKGEEIFEIDLPEEKEDDYFEVDLPKEKEDDYFEIDPENPNDIEAMLSAVGDISREKENWKDDMKSSMENIPNLDDEELEEVKMMGISNTVQKSAGTSAGPEKSVENRKRQTSSMPINENKKVHNESKIDELKKENKRLSESVKEMSEVITNYKSSFIDLRKQFNEMQTFNAKLAYANKIFASGGLSTSDKAKIAEQFDKTKTVDEAKILYNSIIKENKTIINKNNVQKIKSPTTNAVKPKNEPLFESKEMKRMKVIAGIEKPEEI